MDERLDLFCGREAFRKDWKPSQVSLKSRSAVSSRIADASAAVITQDRGAFLDLAEKRSTVFVLSTGHRNVSEVLLFLVKKDPDKAAAGRTGNIRVFKKIRKLGKNLHIDFGISGYAGSVHPKAPDTFLKFLPIPEAVCNAEEDPKLSQKAMLLFLRESRNPGREAEGINRERSADCTFLRIFS